MALPRHKQLLSPETVDSKTQATSLRKDGQTQTQTTSEPRDVQSKDTGDFCVQRWSKPDTNDLGANRRSNQGQAKFVWTVMAEKKPREKENLHPERVSSEPKEFLVPTYIRS